MKNRSYVLIIFLIFGVIQLARGQTGIGTSQPDQSAQLDVTSTDKGVLIPRMTEAQKNGISSPAKGLLIFQVDGATEGFYYFDGSAWVALSASGPVGPQGPPGIGGGAIIPFTSGTPVLISTSLEANQNPLTAIGIGSKVEGFFPNAGTINLDAVNNIAVSVPRDGTITALSAFYSNALLVSSIGSTATIHVQLYQSVATDNMFTPVPGATVNLAPAFTGVIGLGAVSSGIVSGLNISVTAGTRLILVFSISVEGISTVFTLTGHVNGAVAID